MKPTMLHKTGKRFNAYTNKDELDEFDRKAATVGLSRVKLLQFVIKWIATGMIDISQLIRIEMEKE